MEIKNILCRVYVNDIEMAITFYENLLQTTCGIRFVYKEINLELAQIGNLLIIAGSDEALKPFRSTSMTLRVDSITEYKDFLLKNNARIIRDITPVPTGFNMTAQHEDSTIVEYVEFTKQ